MRVEDVVFTASLSLVVLAFGGWLILRRLDRIDLGRVTT